MYLPFEQPSQDISRAQVQSARDNGCRVGAYLWLYRTADPTASANEALSLMASLDLKPYVLWVDLEPYTDGTLPTVDQTLRCLEEINSYASRTEAGIYTGAWAINGHMGGTHAFKDYPLWSADYSLAPDDLSAGYGGWDAASGHQYSSQPVDRSRMLSSVC
jgi:GH25 family lysozyme M1 (1,4-beta-N-acetylmuramidase)